MTLWRSLRAARRLAIVVVAASFPVAAYESPITISLSRIVVASDFAIRADGSRVHVVGFLPSALVAPRLFLSEDLYHAGDLRSSVELALAEATPEVLAACAGGYVEVIGRLRWYDGIPLIVEVAEIRPASIHEDLDTCWTAEDG